MRFNHFSIIDKPFEEKLADLHALGFKFETQFSAKRNLKNWLLHAPIDLTTLAANGKQDVLAFLNSDNDLTWHIFYAISLQLLDFVANFEFQLTDSLDFARSVNLPLVDTTCDLSSENVLSAIYLLMNTRRKNGMTLVEHWVSENLLPLDNCYHFFNDKTLATFDTTQLIREVVYVESAVDTQNRGTYDLIKVDIIRPKFDGKLPAIMTASPYHFGTNGVANDKKLHDMTLTLAEKPLGIIEISDTKLALKTYPKTELPNSETTEHFTHTWTYSLNDYFLARGFASIYVASVGTRGSDGFQTSGDYQQIAGVTAVIDWLNGRARAFTSRQKTALVTADWATGHVAMTGKSYLGTLAYGAATTGISGLDVILAEAGITNWYDYYRENGLIRSPGGFSGEDLDVLAELTYTRNLDAADFLANNTAYQKQLADMSQSLTRNSGDYNSYWHARNYLPNADKVKADVLIVHGLQDFNVTTSHAFKFWQALPKHVVKHAFLHQGSHIYMNNWQSIDFSETINAYFTAKLLARELTLDLPPVIWQKNTVAQSFESLATFGAHDIERLTLGGACEIASFDNHYSADCFDSYSQNFQTFKADLFENKANAIVIDVPISKNMRINGQIVLDLRVKINDTKGLLSAQILDFGKKKRLNNVSSILDIKTIDRGRNFMLDDLNELTMADKPYQVVTKGFLNLQNRKRLTERVTVPKNEWLSAEMRLQPTIYELTSGDTLRLVIYSTDFEHTVRDNREVRYEIDLEKSRIFVPTPTEKEKNDN
ncbi:Xaa-Pro dipeptidyl-peptidase [Lactococcus hodotermopsidis]|uniref:Xaa-Pro dipeptidyl-peptidase n=1 Tax=Pseudolactococcus hodotermopsidis TaxID=2709157 RepID=A0A6A0BAQ8_9LACT|nr:Xaa-Pro dipeptidyl-peptidase [Lactococcus hodotermopsidis]GFH41474.1 Xaa-Pro dipeptidyl-peptidase [Lactococcus hodotermopsidis]